MPSSNRRFAFRGFMLLAIVLASLVWTARGTCTAQEGPQPRKDPLPALLWAGTQDMAGQPSSPKLHIPNVEVDSLMAGNPIDVVLSFDRTTFAGGPDYLGKPNAEAHRVTSWPSKQQALARLDTLDVEVIRDYSHLPLAFVRIHSVAALAQLLADSDISGVFPNAVFRAASANLDLIGQPAVAGAGFIGAGSGVAVIDGPADFTQPAFGSCTAPGVPSSCTIVQLVHFGSGASVVIGHHGTNVAGIVHDVAPGARIVSLDVFSGDTATFNDILAALNWCLQNRLTFNLVAVNMSIVGSQNTQPCPADPVESAVSNLLANNILTTISAGNDGFADRLTYPSCAPSSLSVGAVWSSNFGPQTFNDPPHPICTDSQTAADKITCFSQSASFLTLLAPGALITAAGQTFEGTSQAAPHVAGALAVIRAAHPTEQIPTSIERLLGPGVQISDQRNGLTKPRLNLQAAMFGPFPGCSLTTVTLPLSTAGTLLSSGCYGTDSLGRLYYENGYQFAGQAGQVLTVDMSSSLVDTYLLLVNPGGSVAQSASSSPGNTRNSHLTFTLNAPGTWQIYAGPYWPWASGPYALTATLSTPGAQCVASSTRLCLSGGRFQVTAAWQTTTASGQGTAVTLTPDTGYFWFFSSANVEMLVKVLDACGLNGKKWVFAGGLTNVNVVLTAIDMQTGASRTYVNPQNTAYQPIQDTGAFSTCP